MGTKGDKNTEAANLSAIEMVEKLASIGGISSKKMFGGHGLFHEGRMFGIIDSKGKAFLKTNDRNRQEFESKGSEKHSRMPYYTIPNEVADDLDSLLSWASLAIEISKK